MHGHWVVSQVAVTGDRLWAADQAVLQGGHEHTVKLALRGMTLVEIPVLVSSF